MGTRNSNHVDNNTLSNIEGCHSKTAVLSSQWQSMISHQLFDANPINKAPSFLQSSQTGARTWLGSMTDFSSQYHGFGRMMSMGFNPNSSTANSVNHYHLPQGCWYNNKGVTPRFIASDGDNSFSPLATNPFPAEFIGSPEQISSITACSEADLYSDGEILDSGSTFPYTGFDYLSQSSSENYFPGKRVDQGKLGSVDQRGVLEINQIASYECFPKLFTESGDLSYSNGCVLEHISERIPKMSNSLPSVVTGNVISRHEDQYQVPLLHQLPNCLQFDEQSKPQCRGLPLGNQYSNDIFLQNSFNSNQIPVQQECEIQQKEPCVLQQVGVSNILDSSDLPLKYVLLLYSHYKAMPENNGKDQANLLHVLHKKLCKDKKCNCDQYHIFISHYENCRYRPCTLCKPVRELLSTVTLNSGPLKAIHVRDLNGSSTSMVEDAPPPPKRMRMGDFVHSSLIAGSEDQSSRYNGTSDCKKWLEGHLCTEKIEGLMKMETLSSPEVFIQAKKKEEFSSPEVLVQAIKTEQLYSPEDTIRASVTTNHISDNTQRVGCDHPFVPEEVNDVTDNSHRLNSDVIVVLEQPSVVQEPRDLHCASKPHQLQSKPEVESKPEVDPSKTTGDHQFRTNLGGSGKLPVSYVDFLNSEQMKEHINSLSLSVVQPIRTESKESTMANCVGESTCQLCSMDKLVFGVAPLYCSYCCNLIKHNLIYYWALDETGSRHCFCTRCFKVSRGASISSQGHSFTKAQMRKERNNEENEESWVQCDKCERWQHQICGLYNAKRDAEGNAKYICPYCRLEEIKIGEHVPLPACLGAKDLPRTMLSDHIERRLFRQLQREREERAKHLNKDINEVPGAAELVVRVVSSVGKVLKVKKQFLDIFPDEGYPVEFPYKSKVILLFQKIEGIDVCLFGMYVQEFGSECGQPNQRSVYVSYLDSIKYFRPEILCVTGEALRTYVYHEILIGYLDYCKLRGFATCHIWACPPYKKEDYIFNCHPESQKTPKPDKLRQWYKSMLKKAVKDGVVVDHTTLYESFFMQNGECNNKITAARLPYFDGGFWSGAAEDMIRKMEKEIGGESEGKVKKLLTKRTLKAMGHNDLNIDSSKDIMVMQKLGQTILPVKEDFLVVQLLFTCKNCHNLILSGGHWFCNQCKKFYLCSRCLEMEQNLKERKVHTSISGEEHLLSQVIVNDSPADTAEEGVVLDNDIFENRHSFLSYCLGNNYQFNTLRCAKHSSMMILYDLHKQSVLTRKITCSICRKDIKAEARWHCEICPKFDVCDTCYFKYGVGCHNHKLILHFPKADCGVHKNEVLPEKPDEVRYRKALEHASSCRGMKTIPCVYPECRQIKRLFHHSTQCNIRLAGGCRSCRRIWILICLHSVTCKDSNCRVPRCRSIKEHFEMCLRKRFCMFCFYWRQYLAGCTKDDLGQALT